MSGAALSERAIDVSLADDNPIVRDGVRAHIERHPELRAVGVAADCDEVVSGVAATEPQVLANLVAALPGRTAGHTPAAIVLGAE